MTKTVTISADALYTLIDGASEWSNELAYHIAPASHDFGDTESAESQEEQSREIDRAITLARKQIEEATED